MSFNSIAFAFFLPIVFLLYWIIPPKYQWVLLLISSYYFYSSWSIKYVFLIFFTTVASYICGLLLIQLKSNEGKKIVVGCTLTICLGLLILFKYFNFFTEVFCDAVKIFSIQLHPVTLNLMLPVGISFYTFQTLSYVIDIYHKKIEPERHLGKYAAFISFFPQLVAGPIERAYDLLPQIKQVHNFKYENAVYGLRQMLWGFLKKIIIADTLAPYVDLVFDSVYAYKGCTLLIVSLFFSFQIYCDFSGYSDIAIGAARLFGIRLTTNFKSPYLATSINKFWKCWHVTLSSWFRDYVYIPLGGNRKGSVRKYVNIMMTFLLSGLWHGANMTFVFWGGLHGGAQIVENVFKSIKHRKNNYLSAIYVFTFVTFAWIFFRANSLQEAIYIIGNMFRGINNPFLYVVNGFAAINLKRGICIKIGIWLMVLFIFDWVNRTKDCLKVIDRLPKIIRWGGYYIIGMLLILYCFRNISNNQFVYFQF